MFGTTHIRNKLALALAVPMVALVALAGFEVLDARAQVSDARSQARLAEASIGPGSLLVHLQDERNRTSIDLIGLGSAVELPVATAEEARSLTDTAAVEFRNETDSRGEVVVAAFAPAWTAFEGLEALRADVDSYEGPRDSTNDELADTVFQRYTDMIEVFFDATSQVILTVDDAGLRNGAAIVDAATRQGEVRAGIVRILVLAGIRGGLDDPAVRQEVAALYDRGRAFDDTIRTNSSGPYAGVGDGTFAEPGIQSFNRQVESYLAGGSVDITQMLGAVAPDPDIGYTLLRAKAADILSGEAARVQDDAVFRQRLFGGVALTGLILTAIVTAWASRSITRPLRSLKTQAEEMAGHRLPAAVRQILDTPLGEDVVMPEVKPIEVNTADEVAGVAAALSEVQSSAIDLAVEQAVLRRNISDSYVNLGRRNQNLLSRQLDFITELERNETDPDSLAGLFRLDHLATRMRRNAESLLVLAGIEPPRQWSAPMKVADVIRASLGEVEDYQRVVVRQLEPASVTGSAAAGLAHVLAELIENALSFSPPDQSVEVKGRITTGGYTVAVSDNGLGMPIEDVERANRRLAGNESFTVAPSRYLGHYVAGHLASRLGVVVELQDSPAGGITARVDVPMAMLADDELDHGPSIRERAASATIETPADPVADDSVADDPTPVRPAPASDPVRPEPRPAAPVPATATDPQPADPSVAPPASEPEVAGETTASGLARRSERPRSLVSRESSPPDQPAVDAPAGPVAAVTPASTDAMPAPLVPRASSPAPDPPAPAPEPATEPTESQSPAAIAKPAAQVSRGFGGLAISRPTGPSMYTVAANNAHPERNSSATPGGLVRRVPGAQRPSAGISAPDATVDPAPTEPVRTSAEDVYSFLSSFQSGVTRGRADAATEPPTDPQEDER